MADGGPSASTLVVNRDELLKRVEGDRELLRELIALFFEELPERLEAIRVALEQDDLQSIHELVHSIKGSVSNFAAAPAFEAASRVNDLSRAGTRDGLKAAVEALERELDRLHPALLEIAEE
jgi:two-component system sensor histidine kinase/response regulator